MKTTFWLCVVILVGATGCTPNITPETEKIDLKPADANLDFLRRLAEAAVKPKLLSPTTAKFEHQLATVRYDARKKVTEGTVMGNVDSLNPYGVPVRLNYFVVFTDPGRQDAYYPSAAAVANAIVSVRK